MEEMVVVVRSRFGHSSAGRSLGCGWLGLACEGVTYGFLSTASFPHV
jgi:hypothetical protein